eukprot:s3117_g3.t1
MPSSSQSPSNAAGEGEVGRLVSGAVPDNVRRAIFDLATLGPQVIEERRRKEIEAIESRAKDLGANGQHPCTKDKCLQLFRELVTETQFPDLEVCKFMEEGVSLVGVEPASPLFPPRPRPMKATPEQLDAQAVWRRRELLSRPPQKLPDDELDILNAETEEECKMGFLEGPFSSENEVSSRLGTGDWSPSQRFLLLQGEDKKPRVIDSLRDSGINASFGPTSHLHMHDIDFVLRLDKQVPVLAESLRYAVIAMPGRDRQWVFYLARGLPFGGSGSVFSFNKVSRALWHVAVAKLGLLTSVFVDDFPTLEVTPLVKSASDAFSRLLNALGWAHATAGKKAVDFGDRWVALGAKFDVSRLHLGELEVSNKEGRSDHIQSLAERMLDDGADLRQLATSLQGLLNFASGFTLGSSLKPLARTCSRIAARPASFGAEALKQMNDLLRATLSSLKPRLLRVSDPRKPVILYTDGLYENESALWGAFFIDLESEEKFVLSGTVPESVRKLRLIQAGQQIICEIELFAVVCAKWAYGRRMATRKAFIFITRP